MDLLKQYIVQSITAASNSLRLTTNQLETLGLLKECLIKSGDLKCDINKMKTITELSTLGIRLDEIHSFLSADRIDFIKLSEQFKLHSQTLINDVNHLLDSDNPEIINGAINKINGTSIPVKEITEDSKQKSVECNSGNVRQNDETTGDNAEEIAGVFNNYENLIMKPIKPIDTMLKKLLINEVNYDDLSKFAEIMKMNSEISEQNGFEIISQMHNILCRALLLLKSRNIQPEKDVIESMRACLIVIVAVVKGKDVDITNYLKRAEDFEKEVNSVKIRV